MRLDLSRIRTPREHYEKVYPPETFAAQTDTFVVAAPVALAFDILKDKQHFRLMGRVQTTLEMPCSRCLEPFRLAVDAPFDLRYQPLAEDATGVEREIEEDDLATTVYEHDEIDLGQLMREQFYLVLPMKPLCGEDCRGLCPVCGANLNRETCGCRREWEDPRLAVLKQLKDDNDRKAHGGH